MNAAPIPGETKVWQYVTLFRRVYLIDCPGIVHDASVPDDAELVLRVRIYSSKGKWKLIGYVLGSCTNGVFKG